MAPFRLEICIDSLASALACVLCPHDLQMWREAKRGGSSPSPLLDSSTDRWPPTADASAGPYLRDGDRFEVCGSLLAGGGTTPSIGLVTAIRDQVPHVALMVMIRPRPGSFIYTPPEVDTMFADIAAAREAGAAGVVFGCLDENGDVDLEITTNKGRKGDGWYARGTDTNLTTVTFHRAFDVTPSWQRAADALAAVGVARVLTSGHARTALEGAAELDALTRHFADPAYVRPASTRRIAVLPGSGVNASTLAELKRRAPLLAEAHFTGSGARPGLQTSAVARGAELGFGGDEWVLDVEKVRAVRELVDSWEE